MNKGETVLHSAIVNQHVSLVKFLLKNNANMYQQCMGKFYCPDDQKKHRKNVVTQENPIVPIETNYSGFSYYGEYPLSFAAIMNQYDCVRLLFAYGVNPDRQDINGNTVLHMLVIRNNLVSFMILDSISLI
jgi:hypothetical protein